MLRIWVASDAKKLTCQELIDGYLTSLVLVRMTFEFR